MKRAKRRNQLLTVSLAAMLGWVRSQTTVMLARMSRRKRTGVAIFAAFDLAYFIVS